jgi:hypothetical protein
MKFAKQYPLVSTNKLIQAPPSSISPTPQANGAIFNSRFSTQSKFMQVLGILDVWNLIGRDGLSAIDISYIHDVNTDRKYS